jgi:hypothetical protein
MPLSVRYILNPQLEHVASLGMPMNVTGAWQSKQ